MARGKRTGKPPGAERRCLGKRSYDNQAAAIEGIEANARNRGIYVPHWRAYRCRHCGHWHIGHRPGLGRERGI